MSIEAIDRLIAVIEAENLALQEGGNGARVEFASQKARCLMELAGIAPESADETALKERSKQLRDLLARNAMLLKVRIEVSETLSDSLARRIKAEQSDGTYHRFGRERR